MNALGDMAMAMVAGGDGLPTIFIPGTPLVMDLKNAGNTVRPLPFP